jgi:hypothetical protein
MRPEDFDHVTQITLFIGGINMVTPGPEAPDEINIFSSSLPWFFQPSQCFVNTDN